MVMLGREQVFDKFRGNTSEIDIRLNQGIVHRLTGIGFKQLTFQLKIADRHDQFLS